MASSIGATCAHSDQGVNVFCAACGAWRIRPGSRLLTLLLAAFLAAGFLFRTANQIWPTYFVTALAMLSLYAVVLSGGESFRAAALSSVLPIAGWLLWSIVARVQAEPTFTRWAAARQLVAWRAALLPHLVGLTIAAWALFTLWAILVGPRTAVPELGFASGYFLTLGAYTFGLWGAAGLMIERGETGTALFGLLRWAAVLAPLGLLLALYAHLQTVSTGGLGGRRRRVFLLGVWLFAVVPYLASLSGLVQLFDYGLGRFLPNLLGRPAVTLPPLARLAEAQQVQAWVGIGLGPLALLSLVAVSIVDALDVFPLPETFYTRKMVDLVAARKGLRGLDLIIVPVVTTIQIIALFFTLWTYRLARFLWALMRALLCNALRTASNVLRGYLSLLAPLAAFSLIAAMLVLALRGYRDYAAGSRQLSPLVLWGETVATAALFLLIGGVILALLPHTPPRYRKAGAQVAILMSFVYIALSLTLLLPFTIGRLQWLGLGDVPMLAGGPLLATNTVVFITAAVLLVAAHSLPGGGGRTMPKLRYRLLLPPLAVALVALTVLFGIVPLVRELLAVARAA